MTLEREQTTPARGNQAHALGALAESCTQFAEFSSCLCELSGDLGETTLHRSNRSLDGEVFTASRQR